MTYIMKDGSTEVRDTKRGQYNFEAIYNDEIKRKVETVLIWKRG